MNKKHYEICCFRYADEVSVGDEVLAQVKNELSPAIVMNVSNLNIQGGQSSVILCNFCFCLHCLAYAGFEIYT